MFFVLLSWPSAGQTVKYRNRVRGLVVCEVCLSWWYSCCRLGSRYSIHLRAPHARCNGVFGHGNGKTITETTKKKPPPGPPEPPPGLPKPLPEPTRGLPLPLFSREGEGVGWGGKGRMFMSVSLFNKYRETMAVNTVTPCMRCTQMNKISAAQPATRVPPRQANLAHD